jgi:hypothetical protein
MTTNKPAGVANPTISEVLEQFLADQRTRLKPRTMAQYEDIIELLRSSLNSYAYNYLSKEESERFDQLYDQRLEFCDVFGPDKILPHLDEFLGYFMVRKVIAGQETLRAAGTVTKKLARWLHERGYVDKDEMELAVEESTDAARDLPRAERLANLLYDFATSQPSARILEKKDDQFVIERVEPGRLWLSGFMTSGRFWPIAVPREISDLAEEGWRVTLLLGRTTEGWRILEVGNVYP